MRAFPFVYRVGRVLICFVCIGGSALYAQDTTLKQCFAEYMKARQTIDKSSPSHQLGLVTLNDPYAKAQHDWEECVKGHQMPSLSFKTLNGESYNAVSLTDKILVVNFWFMSCAPCRAELPALNKLADEYKGRNVLFLGFSTDPADRLTPAFFKENRFDFKIIAGSTPIASSFHFLGFPTTYIVDGRGVIRDTWSGLGLGYDKMEPYYRAKAVIDKLLIADKK